MQVSTEICNLALGHLAASTIQDAETEQSTEAKVCRLFYSPALREYLRDFRWPFASRIQALALIEEEPNSLWKYSYRYPSDCLDFYSIISPGLRAAQTVEPIPFVTSGDGQGQIIFTDQPDAEAEYGVYIDDPNLLPADFIMGFSFRLAFYMAPRLTKGDPFKLGERAWKASQSWAAKAQYSARVESKSDPKPTTESITARDS